MGNMASSWVVMCPAKTQGVLSLEKNKEIMGMGGFRLYHGGLVEIQRMRVWKAHRAKEALQFIFFILKCVCECVYSLVQRNRAMSSVSQFM